ncbi:MAG: RHS repeat-associated core domain-containing protein [Hungatella hathewayi]|uniref:RHS repeat-associated core domain-containing protein n=1 Tax=Hungatella hathewayi TaxID=154046 RepID=UPI001FA6F696|nr:RHS repeat-associated core domain-containing protein [Hungatella hathewayi]
MTAYTVNSEATDSYSYAGNQRNSRNSIWTEARDVIQNETSFYLYDGRGSVTGVTWDKSRVTAVYQYDPYGQVTLGTTDHVDFYGYNGESYNPNTGLEYLRARYYNANQGRFFQEDTYLGDITDPLTLNRYAYVKNSPLNYVDPSGHTSVGVDKGNEGKFNGLKKAAMKVAGKLLDSSKDMPLRSSTGAVFGIISSHIMIAVALSEDTLCIDWEEVQLSVGSYLLGMYTESLYYSGVNLIGQDKMDMLELLQAILGTDREYKYAVENLDASAYYYGKALVDDMYAGLGEIMTSPLTMLAELLGMLGSSGGGSVSYGAIKGSASGLALEGGVVLSSGVVIAVGIVAAGGIAGSIIQFSGSARGDVNREKAEQVAEGDSNTKYEGQKYLGERKRENDFVNDKGKSTLDKHAGKRGYESPEDYLNDARNFLEKDPTSTTQSFVSKAGTYFRYDTNTNEFGIINEYGGISTYFKPEEGLTYWLEQIELYAP